MSSKIEWTDETWNPTLGCTRVSAGCDNCYAIRQSRIRSGNPHPAIAAAHAGLTAHVDGRLDWTGDVRLLPERLDQPLRWRRPRRIFVDSLTDLFHPRVPDGFIARVWDVMARCPQHTFQILTKRPDRMRAWVTRWADTTGDELADRDRTLPPMPRGPEAVRRIYGSGRAGLFADMLDSMGEPPEGAAYPLYDWMEGPRWWPAVVPNVWLGASVEDQKRADLRIPALLDTPAAVRWISAEPLLGPVELSGRQWLPTSADDPDVDAECPTCGTEEFSDRRGHPVIHHCGTDGAGPCQPLPNGDCQADGEETGAWCPGPIRAYPRINWVVVGGESGPGARPMHPAWARSLRDECAEADVPFHFKQWGDWGPGQPPNWRDYRADRRTAFLPDGTRYRPTEPDMLLDPGMATVFRVGKRAAGRELDGRTWDEIPRGDGR